MIRPVRSALLLTLIAASVLLLGAGSHASGEVESSEAPQRVTLLSEAARPGEPVTVAFALPYRDGALTQMRAVLITQDGRRVAAASAFPIGSSDDGLSVFCAILAVPSTCPGGTAKLCLESAEGVSSEQAIEVLGRDFMREEIALNRDNTELRTADDPKKRAESTELWRILVSFDPSSSFASGAFLPPVDSPRRTSFYGDRRRYRYTDGSSDSSIHAGIDYGVPSGTPVRAAAAGRVVLARPRIVTGNSVVIEHLPGVFTLYYHLDRLEVVEGDEIEAGKRIGYSGSTGLSTGPHLHWEVRVSGEAADPDVFLARAVLDKDSVLSKMGGHYDR
jgi:hypothetical protein